MKNTLNPCGCDGGGGGIDITTSNVTYNGAAGPCIPINTGDNLTTILQKIDLIVCQLNNEIGDFYTKAEVDALLEQYAKLADLLSSGQIVGKNIVFNNDAGIVFSVDASAFLAQGVTLTYINEVLRLLDADGNVLSSVEIDPGADFSETIISTLGTLNDLIIPTSFARFTGQGQVILTGVDIGGQEGKSLLIRNETGQEMTVIHDGVSSTLGNRFYISDNGDDLPLGLGCAAWFMYSLSLQRWQLVDTWGNGYSPHLVGTGQRTVVANADGSTGTEDTFLFEENRDDILVFPSKSTLDGLYPDAPEGFRVYCKNIAGGGAVFRKHDEVTGVWGYQMYTELS